MSTDAPESDEHEPTPLDAVIESVRRTPDHRDAHLDDHHDDDNSVLASAFAPPVPPEPASPPPPSESVADPPWEAPPRVVQIADAAVSPLPPEPDLPRRRGLRIDPRMRARRIEVRRQEGRRRLRLVVVLGVLGFLVIVALAVLFSPVFAVRTVVVSGVDNTDAVELQAVIQSLKGSAMLTVDLDSARARLLAEPWVQRVSISRQWPRTVHVDVKERTPVAAYLGDDGQWRVVDPEGRVLAQLGGRPINLPAIYVDGQSEAIAEGGTAGAGIAQAAKIVQHLPDSLRTMTDGLYTDVNGTIWLQRDAPKFQLVLGDDQNLHEKLIAAITVIQGCKTVDQIRVLDVRAPSLPVYSPANACPSLTGKP